MEAFCNKVVEEIKAAENELELMRVIGSSMWMLRKQRNSYNESGYILNMIASLRATQPAGEHSARTLEMIGLAIDIFRQLQKDRHERIF